MELSELNWFDIVVISIVAVSSLLAFFRGFLKALISLITWLGAAATAYYLGPYLKDYLLNYFSESNDFVLNVISRALVFIFFFAIIAIINSKILYWIRHYRKGFVDKTLGFAFGFARGLAIVCIFFFCIDTISQMISGGEEKERYGPPFFTEAKTYNLLDISTQLIISSLPDEFEELSIDALSQLKDTINEKINPATMQAGVPRELNDDEKQIMKKVIQSLPKSTNEAIRKKYGHKKSKEMSELEKMSIYRDILNAYNESVKSKEISNDKKISDDNIKSLDDALNGRKIKNGDLPKDEGTGYKELNIKQLDRLVDSIE